MMRALFSIILLGILSSCGTLNPASALAEIGINNSPDSGAIEAGCFEFEYTGTWTKSRTTYRKVVIPDNWPDGVEVPGCD